MTKPLAPAPAYPFETIHLLSPRATLLRDTIRRGISFDFKFDPHKVADRDTTLNIPSKDLIIVEFADDVQQTTIKMTLESIRSRYPNTIIHLSDIDLGVQGIITASNQGSSFIDAIKDLRNS